MAMADEITMVFNLLTTNYGYAMKDTPPEKIAGLLDIWKQLLADIPVHILKAATLKHISESKWFPSVAELRESAGKIMCPNHTRTGIEAWGDVVKAFHEAGYYGSPAFDDPVTATVVKSMGWQTLCLSEDQTADRARFIDGYNSIAKRERENAMMLPQVRDVAEMIAQRSEVPALRSGDRG